MRSRLRLLVVFCLAVTAGLHAQEACVPPALTASRAPNMFVGPLEAELGKVAEQQFARSLRVVEDDVVTAYLRRIGDRLAQHMPASPVPFRYFVYDSGELNALSMPGGGIYVSRKLIANAHSEDELAGVLAHEMGHELAGHIGTKWTLLLRTVLNVNALKDAADVRDNYHRLLDSYRQDPGRLRHLPDAEDQEQAAADQVGIYATALSGYTPTAYVDFWDRINLLKGQAGSWISDLFGTSHPPARRLRDLRKDITKLPPSCVQSKSGSSPDEFRRWQASVIAYSGLGRREQIHNVLVRRPLAPDLREPIEFLRFSPDGKYILAQDTASIYVLSRVPFAPILRIPAYEANAAQFTPDSQSIVFYDDALRVEKWSIVHQRMESVDEVYSTRACGPTALSPDGKYLACLHFSDDGTDLGLSVLNVSSSEVAFHKNSFVDFTAVQLFAMYMFGLNRASGELHFSPDGRYLLAASKDSRLGLDLSTMKELPLPSSVKNLMGYSFAFLPGSRLAGIGGIKGDKSAVVQFPEGSAQVIDLPLGRCTLHGGSGDRLVLGNLLASARGLYNIQTRKFDVLSQAIAFDVYDRMFVSERRNGELALHGEDLSKPLATAALPSGPLGTPHAAAVSADLRWLALSTADRGAVWDLATKQRVLHVPDFHGIAFGKDGFVLDFPPPRFPMPKPDGKPLSSEERKKLGDRLVRLEPQTKVATLLKEYTSDTEVRQIGPYVLLLTRGPDKHTSTFEARDAATLALLWSRRLETVPMLRANDEHPESFVLLRDLDDRSARRDMKAETELKKTASAIKDREYSYLVEVVETKTGSTLGKFPVETHRGSFRLLGAFAAGDRVVFTDLNNRVLLYSLNGQRMGQMFGGRPVVSRDNSRLVIEHAPGRLALYELPSLRKLDDFTFATRVLYAALSADGQQLLVVTDDQTLFMLGVTQSGVAKATN